MNVNKATDNTYVKVDVAVTVTVPSQLDVDDDPGLPLMTPCALIDIPVGNEFEVTVTALTTLLQSIP